MTRRRPESGGDPAGLSTPRRRAASREEADAAIRAVWPEATGSGSVRAWGWFLPQTPADRAAGVLGRLVGEAWEVAGPHWENRGWWYRVTERKEAA